MGIKLKIEDVNKEISRIKTYSELITYLALMHAAQKPSEQIAELCLNHHTKVNQIKAVDNQNKAILDTAKERIKRK